MSKLYLTTGKTAGKPYRMRLLARNVYTAEELCFSLAQCASFLDESFLDTELVGWLGTECGLLDLAASLRQLLLRKAPVNEFVAMILLYVGYQSPEEVEKIRMEVAAGRGMAPFQRMLQEAWFTAGQGRTREAEALMDRILEQIPDPEREMRAEIWRKKGQLRTREFHFSSAAKCFHKEWEMSGSKAACRRYLAALKFSMTEEQYQQFLAEGANLTGSAVSEADRKQVQSAIEEAAKENEERIRETLRENKSATAQLRRAERYLEQGNERYFDAHVQLKVLEFADSFRRENEPSL